jgi:hypothetical protein
MLHDTIEDRPAATRWEPCGTFSSHPLGSPVCSECGWLDHEHGARATVRRLPTKPLAERRPRRLAS